MVGHRFFLRFLPGHGVREGWTSRGIRQLLLFSYRKGGPREKDCPALGLLATVTALLSLLLQAEVYQKLFVQFEAIAELQVAARRKALYPTAGTACTN